MDILVNNAGTTRDMLLAMMPETDWDLVIATNLKSAYNCSKAALKPMMRQKYGRIVNISSVSGLAGNGGQTNYSASKAGLIGFTKALAKEVGGRNITVNAVAPGFIPTDLTDVDSGQKCRTTRSRRRRWAAWARSRMWRTPWRFSSPMKPPSSPARC